MFSHCCYNVDDQQKANFNASTVHHGMSTYDITTLMWGIRYITEDVINSVLSCILGSLFLTRDTLVKTSAHPLHSIWAGSGHKQPPSYTPTNCALLKANKGQTHMHLSHCLKTLKGLRNRKYRRVSLYMCYF